METKSEQNNEGMESKITCSWCQRQMGTLPFDPAMNGYTSHGICQQCKDGLEWPKSETASGVENIKQVRTPSQKAFDLLVICIAAMAVGYLVRMLVENWELIHSAMQK